MRSIVLVIVVHKCSNSNYSLLAIATAGVSCLVSCQIVALGRRRRLAVQDDFTSAHADGPHREMEGDGNWSVNVGVATPHGLERVSE